MNRRIARLGVLTGITGGSVMAVFAMIAMGALGQGTFTLINLIAHTFWRDAPLDGSYVFSALVIGLGAHLVVSMFVGTVIAFFVERGSLDGGIIFFIAVIIGVGAWMTQNLVWPTLDDAAHNEFTPWVLAVAHVMFALGAATALSRLERRSEPNAAHPADDASGATPTTATTTARRFAYQPFE